MFAFTCILTMFVALSFLASTIEIFFSPEELSEMGVCLENVSAFEPVSSSDDITDGLHCPHRVSWIGLS